MAAENLVSSEMLLLDAIHIARMTSMQKSRFLFLRFVIPVVFIIN